jgi:hypothetical protein
MNRLVSFKAVRWGIGALRFETPLHLMRNKRDAQTSFILALAHCTGTQLAK